MKEELARLAAESEADPEPDADEPPGDPDADAARGLDETEPADEPEAGRDERGQESAGPDGRVGPAPEPPRALD